MADPNRNIVPRSGGFFEELTTRFRLISRLMMDSRVHPVVKLLPVGALAYAIWPFDIPTPIDDAVVLWVGTTLFVDLCPPGVVEEHLQSLRRKPTAPNAGRDGEVVEGEYFDSDSQQGGPGH